MTLDEAVRDIKARTGGMHHQVACHAFVHSFYTSRDGKHLLRPASSFTTDAARKPSTLDLCDQILAALEKRGKGKRMTRDQIKPDYGSTGSWTPMGALPEAGPVGGELVQLLDNRFTYYVATDGTGRVALFRHGTAEGMLQAGKTTADRAAMMRSMRTVDEKRQAQQRSIASTVREFWAKVA
jgi:hypothetical protein